MHVPLHDNLPDHPKVHKVARILLIPEDVVIAKLVRLWTWAMRFALDGNLGAYDPEDIARAVGWEGDAGALLDALTKAGFIDQDPIFGCTLHDWDEYGGKVAEERRQAAEKQKRYREKKKPLPDVTVTSPSPLPGRYPLEKSREEETRQEQTTQEQPATSSGLDALELLWSKLKKKNPPFSTHEYEAMKEVLNTGLPLSDIKALVEKAWQYKKDRGEEVGTFKFFLSVAQREIERRRVKAEHAQAGSSQPKPTQAKPRITDANHYQTLVKFTQFNPKEWANPDEFAPRGDPA